MDGHIYIYIYIYTTTGFGLKKNEKMAGVYHFLVYVQTVQICRKTHHHGGVLQARLRMLPPRLRAELVHARAVSDAHRLEDAGEALLQVLNYCQQLCLSRTSCACEREWGGECVCVFVGMHIYTYACMHAYLYLYLHVHIDPQSQTHTCMYVRLYVCMHASPHQYVSSCMSTRMYASADIVEQ